MKLSFSTYGWDNYEWYKFSGAILRYKFDAIEIYDTLAPSLSGTNKPLNSKNILQTSDYLYGKNIKISAIDYACDFKTMSLKKNIENIYSVFKNAKILHCKNICLRLGSFKEESKAIAQMKKCIEQLTERQEKLNLNVLIETSGIFADTKNLRELLDCFSRDNIAASWNVFQTYFYAGQEPEDTIADLGAYVKFVKITDCKMEDGKPSHKLIGRGDLPMDNIMLSLSSIDYDGFLSYIWSQSWTQEFQDEELILSHFTNFMDLYQNDATEFCQKLYSNKTKTGHFIWKKEKIIDLTFPQVLDKVCEHFPNQYAFRYVSQDYNRTYVQFRNDVDNFARSLIALGCKKGTKVAIWATNVPEWYIAFWACCRIGAVLVTMNTSYKIAEVEYILNNSDTHTLIMIDEFKGNSYHNTMSSLCPELASNIAGEALHTKRLPHLRHIINVTTERDGCLTWNQALHFGKKITLDQVYKMSAAVSKHDVCNMQYTSGTTGFPKGVMLTHYNVVNNGKCIGDRMDLSTADKMMIMVPMFHCFGMVLSMTASATHAATMCPLPYFSTKPALMCINLEEITCFNGVPTMFIAMMQHPDFKKTDFSHMRTGIMAGSPCPIEVMKQVIDKMNMKEITIVYGQTEASPGCTMSKTTDPIDVRVETVGGPLPGIECKIIDPETGEDLPIGQNGEFVARGYNVMKGYYKLPRETAQAIDEDGWLHTGDIACKDKNGNYRITGRIKDMIIRGGENIYPKEIEEFIYTHPKVKDVQVIGVPDKALGEEIYVAVIPKENENLTEDEVRTFVLDNMAKHKVPKYVEIVDGFLMNSAGKILKYKMREAAIKKFNL